MKKRPALVLALRPNSRCWTALLCGLASALFTLLGSSPAWACHNTDVRQLSLERVGDEWELKIRVCVGGGRTGAIGGADSDTRDVIISVAGPSVIKSFEPATLEGDNTGGILTGFVVEGPISGVVGQIFAPLAGCNDPHGLDGSPYNCHHEARSLLAYLPSQELSPPFTCVTDPSANCGQAYRECNDVTMRFDEKPDGLRVYGLEGAGNAAAGCMPNPDVALVFGTNFDADGIFDSQDVCLAADDRIDEDLDQIPDCTEVVDIDGDGAPDTNDPALCPLSGPDADGDGVPDSCDLCPDDVHNDSDTDGACDSADPCPFQAFSQPGPDGRCGTLEHCGISTATAMYTGGVWQVTAEICTSPPSGPAQLRTAGGYTDNLLLAVYGSGNAILGFSPAEFRMDDQALAPGHVVDETTLQNQALASNAPACTVYGHTNIPCTTWGEAPSAAILYGLLNPPVSNTVNYLPLDTPICRSVTLQTAEAPTLLRAYGLEGNGDLFAGCLLNPAIGIVPTIIDEPDSDGDGVGDSSDVCPSFADGLDADQDGTPDGCDACPVDHFNDSDGDLTCDSTDSCPLDPENDADHDGICGDLEPGCELDPANDADRDGVCSPADTCPADAQNDADADGLCADVDNWDDCDDNQDRDQDGTPDACDVCPADLNNDSDGDGSCDSADPCTLDALDDRDGDGACANLDVCPSDPLNDADVDGICGDVDPCPTDVANDADGDGICESADNCPTVSNADQNNRDHDAQGDACDPDGPDDANADDDHDGVKNVNDTCPQTAPATPVSPHSGCAIVQSCPPTAAWKNHGAYVACVTASALHLAAHRVITPTQAATTIAAAARSNVGKKR